MRIKSSISVAIMAAAIYCSSAKATPIYRETFNFCGNGAPPSILAASVSGWQGFHTGFRVAKISNLKIIAGGAASQGSALSSNQVGPDNGAAFWPKAVSGLLLYTNEFPIPIETVDVVEYYQRLSGFLAIPQPDGTVLQEWDGTKLALQIGDMWYISDQSVIQIDQGLYEKVSFPLKSTTFGRVPASATGPAAPVESGVTLPVTGQLVAFGVFVPEAHGRVRIDNFTIYNASPDPEPVPTPAFYPDCFITNVDDTPLDPTADITPTPAPEGVDPLGQPTPTPTPIQKAYEFCRATRGKAGVSVMSIPKNAAVKTLAKVKGSTFKAMQDKALLQLVLQQKLSPESLANVRVGDITINGKKTLMRITTPRKRNVALRPRVASALRSLLQTEETFSDPNAPALFDTSVKAAQAGSKALCAPAIRKIVQSYARRAGVKVKV